MSKPSLGNLNALIESTNDLIWSVDLDYRLNAFNPAFANRIQIYGCEAALGKTQENLFPQDEAKFLQPLYARALVEGPFQMERVSSDGRTFELRFHPIVTRGRKRGIAVFGRDVTQCRIAEKALGDSERKFRVSYDGGLEGVYRTTPKGKPLAVNPAAARILGYDSPEDFLSSVTNSLDDLWVDRSERDSYKEQLRVHNSVRGLEARFKSKTGTVIWVSLDGRRIPAAERNDDYYESFFKDITAHKEAEKTARFLASVIESSEDAIFTYSPSGEIQTWNRGAERMYGYTAEEVLLQPVTMLVAPERQSFILEYVQGLIQGRSPAHVRGTARKKDGQRMDVSVSSCPIYDSSGAVLAISAIARDESAIRQAEQRLRESEARFRATFDQAAVGIVHIDFDGRHLRCNNKYTEITGYSTEELKGLAFQAITAPNDVTETLSRLERLKSLPDHSEPLEKRFHRKDGSVSWVRITTSVQHDADGHPLHIIGVVEDINFQKSAEEQVAAAVEAMRASEVRYRTAFETSIDAICIARVADGRFIDANRAFIDLFGWDREEFAGKNGVELGLWLCSEDRDAWARKLRVNGECRGWKVRMRKRNKDLFWAEITASEIDVDGERCTMCVTRDVSRVLEAEEQIRNLAFYDALTNLPNRRLLEDRFRQLSAQAMRRGSKIGLLFIDLDEFKPTNDELGHATGDLVLRTIASRLKEVVRTTDTAARIGGDEFVVVLAELQEREDATRIAEMIRCVIANPITTPQGIQLTATASIGAALYPDDAEDLRTLLLCSDEAMYQAKKSGGGTVNCYRSPRAAQEHAVTA